MRGGQGPKIKFILLLVLIHIVVLPVLSFITYYIVKANAVDDAYTTARIYLSAMSGVKHYVSEELRPFFYQALPGRFIVEGMSRSFAASHVAARVEQEMQNYIYKNASLNPRNPRNRADDFEMRIIKRFIAEEGLKEWKGYVTKGDEHFYVVAWPGQRFTSDCLLCHSDPAIAPHELVERYGTEAGFHMKPGELADATLVYIPIGVPIAAARNVVLIFIGLYGLFGTAILLIIHFRFSGLYDTIDADRQRIEDSNVELINLNQDIESIISERTMNLIALSVADRVRNPASVIANMINRILKKEEVTPSLQEKLAVLANESERLDEIVRDYESILRTRHMRFKPEVVNEVVESVLPLVEDERRNKEIRLALKLADPPIQCIGNRQLLRIAILHLLRNAVEAAPQGGEITVETASDGDRVTIAVSDTGEGIAADDLPNIFGVFYSKKRRRMGMGLPIAKQIVKEHRGDIQVHTKSGEGTTFLVVLPLRWTGKELAP
jgi:signal transduction histidine kinase